MSDDFQGNGTIKLQPGDSNVPFQFQVTVASSSTKNDGALPYGSTVSSFTVSERSERGTVSSTHLTIAKSLSGNTLNLRMAYTTFLNPGLYHLQLRVSASIANSTVLMMRPFDFDRIYLGD